MRWRIRESMFLPAPHAPPTIRVCQELKGIGVKDSLLDSTLRFSFGAFNTEEEVDYCLEVLNELVPMLRRYRRA